MSRYLRDPRPRRVAVVSLHTSPLDQPGTGDAGGLNVYVLETARRLAQAGIDVEIFTRAVSSGLPASIEIEPGVQVSHLRAGPFEDLPKEDLPAQMCAFSAELLRAEACRPTGWFDLIHAHYWLSGHVGWLASERWDVPLVQSMHTMAKVKNLELAEGDRPEPQVRVVGEQQVVDHASRLIANTGEEARQLMDLYAAPAHAVDVVHPGVDLETFAPRDQFSARRALGVRPDAHVLLFVGRIQPLKAPDILLRAAARMVEDDPAARERLLVVVCGGPSGSGLEHPTGLVELAEQLGIAHLVRFEPPTDRARLAEWYAAADATVVPSYSESFGLVAIESQACGTPVVAAAVGGLRTSVADGRSGLLVPDHDPRTWAAYLSRITTRERDVLARGARPHAEGFSWDATAQGLIDSYSRAIGEHAAVPLAVSGQ